MNHQLQHLAVFQGLDGWTIFLLIVIGAIIAGKLAERKLRKELQAQYQERQAAKAAGLLPKRPPTYAESLKAQSAPKKETPPPLPPGYRNDLY